MHKSHRDQRLLLALMRQGEDQHSPASAMMVGVPDRGLQLDQAPLHDRVLELHKHWQATLAGPRARQFRAMVGKHLTGAA